jgi:hypothetical protein
MGAAAHTPCHKTYEHTGAQASARARHKQTSHRVSSEHSTAQHSTAQHSTAQHSTAQHSTAQHSTAQHSTAQHSTAQRNTREWKLWQWSQVVPLPCAHIDRLQHMILLGAQRAVGHAVYRGRHDSTVRDVVARQAAYLSLIRSKCSSVKTPSTNLSTSSNNSDLSLSLNPDTLNSTPLRPWLCDNAQRDGQVMQRCADGRKTPTLRSQYSSAVDARYCTSLNAGCDAMHAHDR